jgi:tetratricopeptide (TPR) repeat protein
MHIRNKNSRHHDCPRPKATLTSRLCRHAFRFAFFACCFSTCSLRDALSSEPSRAGNSPVHSPAETAQESTEPDVSIPYTKLPAAPQQERTETNDANLVNFVANAGTKPSETEVPAGVIISSQLGRQLWRARVSIPRGNNNEQNKTELQQAIAQIHSLRFKPQKQTPAPAVVVQPTPTIEPNEAPPVSRGQNEMSENETKFKLPYEPLSDRTLQVLRQLSQHPDRVGSPFELAEVLFLTGNKQEAAIFYKEALNRKSADNLWSAHDRAWILFQTGNCLHNDNPQTAREAYRQLIAEYPDSPWTDLAKAKYELINWYEKDKPETLVNYHISRESETTLHKTEQR